MELKEILEHEGELTQEIRDEVADYEKRMNNYLEQLWSPWDDDDDDEEELEGPLEAIF